MMLSFLLLLVGAGCKPEMRIPLMIENGMFGCAFTTLNLSYLFRVMHLTICSAHCTVIAQSYVHGAMTGYIKVDFSTEVTYR